MTPVEISSNLRMVFHATRIQSKKHFRWYNGPQYSTLVAITTRTTIVGKGNIVLRRPEESDINGNEASDTISNIHHVHASLRYVHLLPQSPEGPHNGRRYEVNSARQIEGKKISAIIVLLSSYIWDMDNSIQFYEVDDGSTIRVRPFCKV